MYIKFGIHVHGHLGIHGYSMSNRKQFVRIRSILLKNWEGIRVLVKVKVFVCFFDFFSKRKGRIRMLFWILLSNYFGIGIRGRC